MRYSGFFLNHSINEIIKKMDQGEISSQFLVEKSLEAIEHFNAELNAFIRVNNAEGLLQQAQQLDEELKQGRKRSPLHGFPLAIKDNIDTKALTTTYGSHFFKEHIPDIDALCVQKLKQAGLIVIGKTLTSEFALGPTGEFSYQGAASNPFDKSRVTGGSSAGNGAAIASGMVPLAIGTDTAGSIRIPASYCGITGFKPTYQAIEIEGVFPVSSTLDHVGPMANEVEGLEQLFKILTDHRYNSNDELLTTSVNWIDGSALVEIDHQVDNFCQQYLADRINKHISISSSFVERFTSSFNTILLSEAYAVHAKRIYDEETEFSPEQKNRIECGGDIYAHQYLEALKVREELIQEACILFFADHPFLAMPTTATTALIKNANEIKINDQNINIRKAANGLTSLWNLLGFPAISICIGQINSLPVGLQLIALPGQDEMLLKLAKTFEKIK